MMARCRSVSAKTAVDARLQPNKRRSWKAISPRSRLIHGRRSDAGGGVLWTNLSRREISRRLGAMGTPASRHTVRRLMKQHALGQRQVRKKKSMGAHPNRDAQFQDIAKLKAEYYQQEGIDRQFCP